MYSLWPLLLLAGLVASQKDVHFSASTAIAFGRFRHFWNSNGFCPPSPHVNQSEEYDLGLAMHQNLLLISSTPNTFSSDAALDPSLVPAVAQEQWQVRVHFLFDLVRYNGSRHTVATASSLPPLDYSPLVTFISRLVDSGMRPGFEIMGNPNNTLFSNFDDPVQVHMWADMVEQAFSRLIDRFGINTVRRWNIMGWNEIDYHDTDGLVMTPSGYCNYYDATQEGLRRVGLEGQMGAPDDGHTIGPIGFRFFAHVLNGTDFFTGKAPVLPSYVGAHHKGEPTSSLGLASSILAGTASQLCQVKEAAPGLLGKQRPDGKLIPWSNDESDPLGGWNKLADWRADARYPAMMAKVITQHFCLWSSPNASSPACPGAASFPTPASDPGLSTAGCSGVTPTGPGVFQGVPLGFLSFDAAFMNFGPDGFWDRRTFTTRFLMNNSRPTPGVETIRKLSLNVMTPLSRLGDEALQVTESSSKSSSDAGLGAMASSGSTQEAAGSSTPSSSVTSPPTSLSSSWPPPMSNVSAIATMRSSTGEASVMLYGSQDVTYLNGSINATVDIDLSGLLGLASGTGYDGTAAAVAVATYTIADRSTDPRSVWVSAGSPVFPDPPLLRSMRHGQEVVADSVHLVNVSASSLQVVARSHPDQDTPRVSLSWRPYQWETVQRHFVAGEAVGRVDVSAPREDGVLRLEGSVPQTGVRVYHVCTRGPNPGPNPEGNSSGGFGGSSDGSPGTPEWVRWLPNPPQMNENVVTWGDTDTRCIRTFEVQGRVTSAAAGSDGDWIDVLDGVSTAAKAYVHDLRVTPGTRADLDGSGKWADASQWEYRVRAVDYWGRASGWATGQQN